MSQSINIFVSDIDYSADGDGKPFIWEDVRQVAGSNNDKPLLFYWLLAKNTKPIKSFQHSEADEFQMAVMSDKKAGVGLVIDFFENILQYDELNNQSEFASKFLLFKEYILGGAFDKKYFLLDGDLYWDEMYFEDTDGLLEHIDFFGREIERLNQLVSEAKENNLPLPEGKKLLDLTESNMLREFRNKWLDDCQFDYFKGLVINK